MGRRRGAREKIRYNFEQAVKYQRSVAGYLKSIMEIAEGHSVEINAKVPPLINHAVDTADIIQTVYDMFRLE